MLPTWLTWNCSNLIAFNILQNFNLMEYFLFFSSNKYPSGSLIYSNDPFNGHGATTMAEGFIYLFLLMKQVDKTKRHSQYYISQHR